VDAYELERCGADDPLSDQLKIESSGTGTLGPTVKIPGLYKASDPGIAFNKW
jgi:hypothetical protein